MAKDKDTQMELDNSAFIDSSFDLNNEFIPDLTNSCAWPELLQELLGVIEQTLTTQGFNEAQSKSLSLKLTLSISEHMGGIQVYFPRGDKLHKEIRDIEIWRNFKGHNIKQLARQYHLTDKTIYEITSRMRTLESKQRQPELF
ncbi:MAG: Mor transcription activator family protein [Psychromonas sp.]